MLSSAMAGKSMRRLKGMLTRGAQEGTNIAHMYVEGKVAGWSSDVMPGFEEKLCMHSLFSFWVEDDAKP